MLNQGWEELKAERGREKCFHAPWVNLTFRCIATKNSRKGDDRQVQVFVSFGPGWVQWEGGDEEGD